MIDIKKVNLREGTVLVQPYDFKEETKVEGFSMPTTIKYQNGNYGLVVSVAKNMLEDADMDIYYGDVIVFDKEDAVNVSMSEEDVFFIVQSYGVLGVIKMDK